MGVRSRRLLGFMAVLCCACKKYRAGKSCDVHVVKLYLRSLRSALRAL
jgi:hypothetical protein